MPRGAAPSSSCAVPKAAPFKGDTHISGTSIALNILDAARRGAADEFQIDNCCRGRCWRGVGSGFSDPFELSTMDRAAWSIDCGAVAISAGALGAAKRARRRPIARCRAEPRARIRHRLHPRRRLPDHLRAAVGGVVRLTSCSKSKARRRAIHSLGNQKVVGINDSVCRSTQNGICAPRVQLTRLGVPAMSPTRIPKVVRPPGVGAQRPQRVPFQHGAGSLVTIPRSLRRRRPSSQVPGLPSQQERLRTCKR